MKNKVYILLELPIFLLFLYVTWHVIFGKSGENYSSLRFVIGFILGLFILAIYFLFHRDEAAIMINKGSWGLYKFTPKGVLKLGYFLIATGFAWLIFLVYHNHGVMSFFKLVIKSLS